MIYSKKFMKVSRFERLYIKYGQTTSVRCGCFRVRVRYELTRPIPTIIFRRIDAEGAMPRFPPGQSTFLKCRERGRRTKK